MTMQTGPHVAILYTLRSFFFIFRFDPGQRVLVLRLRKTQMLRISKACL